MFDSIPEPATIDARHGRLFYLTGDDPIGKSLQVYGEWAEAEIQFLAGFIGRGSVVLDIGANIGTHTLAFARRVGPQGRVHAFEPQAPIFRLLEKALAANGLANVTAFCGGVGERAGEMLVPDVDYTKHANFGGIRLLPVDGEAESGQGGTTRTPIIGIDELRLQRCDLIKVDAEGMEEQVLVGMASALEKLRPIVYLECNTVDIGAAVRRAVSWSGYRMFLVRTRAYNPSNYFRASENLFAEARECGLLCMPDEALDLMPADFPLVEIFPVESLEELATHLLATPRWGDATVYDRDPARLRKELENAIGQASEQLATAQDRIRRVEFRCSSLTKQLSEAERELRAMRLQVSDFEEMRLVLRERERMLEAFRRSTSWRLTMPLRLLRSGLDKLSLIPSGNRA